MKRLARDLIRRMPELTLQRSRDLSLENTRLNQPHINRSVLELMKDDPPESSGSAMVISAGPSLHRANSVQRLLNSGYQGTVICADGALGHCLRAGLIPEYVVTLDPNRTRLVRWFGDVNLISTDEDDYFRRQDLDPYLGIKELERNQELVQLVNQHGPRIKVIIATCASQAVTQRCIESGMELYWWNPLYDDYELPGSLTREVHQLNKLPCLVTGGNVGSAAWVLAHSILQHGQVAMVGMDFGYAPGTPIEKTQYYKEITEMFGDKGSDSFISVRNPHLEETWFTDPAYYWYNESFLQMAKQAACTTYNCTEGGILFGDGISFVSLEEFLASHAGSNGSHQV